MKTPSAWRAGAVPGFALFLSLAFLPSAFSDEAMPLETAADFVRIANNAFPGIAQPVEDPVSAEASNGTPSGQSLDNEPVEDEMTWEEYKAERDKILSQDETQVDFWTVRAQLEDLRDKFNRSEQRRGFGYNREGLQDYRPIDVRAIQIEEGLIDGNEPEVD